MSVAVAATAPDGARRWRLDARHAPLAVTIGLLAIMLAAGGVLFRGFLAPQVLLNLLIDNAFLCIVSTGMTFVILTGGIDLSVGAQAALATMVSATLVQRQHMSPMLVIPLVLALGVLFGGLQGLLVVRCRLQPFLVTLAGMFLARGLCYVISTESIPIDMAFYAWAAQLRFPVGAHASLSLGALLALLVVGAGVWVAHATEFGRTVYAIGGSEASAMLMGLPVRATLVGVYALSGACAALGGVVITFDMQSGFAQHAAGLELDAIAAVVIGGTVLRGGTGYVLGTFAGVLILGVILTLITFDGTLNSWWTRIAIGTLLLVFCLLQRLLEPGARR